MGNRQIKRRLTHGEEKIPVSALWFSLLMGTLGFGLLFEFLKSISSSSQPFLDSLITAFSIVAQIWLARRWIENWILVSSST